MAHAAAPPSPPRAIVSPLVDTLSVGGLSMLVFIPLLLSGLDDLTLLVSFSLVAWTQAIVNYAHFMASYRIVYRSREMILKHKWASIGVPLILLAAAVVAMQEARAGGTLTLTLFMAVASGYLAWHYTGQTWGMMVAFSHLDGARFDRTEYWLIRGGLRILLVWHLAWFLKTTLARPDQVAGFYQAATLATGAGLLSGIYGLWRMWRRTGRVPPYRALVAWAAIFVWYAAIARWGLPALFLVQLAHSIQYLPFPARVEHNRAAQAGERHPAWHTLVYGAVLLGVTMLVVLFVPGPSMSAAARLLGIPEGSVAPILVMYFINIHHFFTDGVVWKLRDPEVQRDLVAHTAPVVATVPVPPMWWNRAFWTRRPGRVVPS